MSNTRANAVYNSRIPQMPSLPPRSSRTVFHRLILLAVLVPTLVWAADWSKPEDQLGAKIATVTGPGAVNATVSNRSSLGPGEVENIRRGLLERLSAAGLRFVDAEQAAAVVQVSLSENLQNYVWTAEIRLGANESSVVMVSTPRPNTPLVAQEGSGLKLHSLQLWASDEPMLDAAIINGAVTHLAVLYSSEIKLYRLENDHWFQEQALPFSHSGPWPRDLRGRVVLRKDRLFDAYLPGVFCRSNTGLPLAVSCQASDDPWPVGTDQFALNAFYAAARNFFTGALFPGIGKKTAAPEFYTAAPLPREKYTLWLLAGVDGRVHLLDGVNDQTDGKLNWGSDLATVHSACGTGWQVLVTGHGAGPTDTVQAFEVPDREPVAASPPVEFAGGVTSLWAAADGGSAVAIVHNAENGKYEAYLLTIACGQ
jgi:hypothetical protein